MSDQAVKAATALLLCSCAAAAEDPRVLELTNDGLRCTAAATSPERAITAAHCIKPPGSAVLLDGQVAHDTSAWAPEVDLATLEPEHPFSAFLQYATQAPVQGDVLRLIGYGCSGVQESRELTFLEPGLADGLACHGDSGGPLLNERDELVGCFSGWTKDGRVRFVQILEQGD